MAYAFRGLAQFAGCAVVFDVILYATQATQDASLTQEYEAEMIKDNLGNDCSERTINEKWNAEYNMKMVGPTAANALAINTISPGGFLPMQQTVNISQPATGPQLPASFIGVFKVKSGTKISTKNAACGDLAIPLERYADNTQNNLMTSTPA